MNSVFKKKVSVLVVAAVAVGFLIAAVLQGFSPPMAFAFAPTISTSGYPGPGDTITVNGGGWPARHTLNISYDSQQLTTAVVRFQLGIIGQPIGAFRASLTVPINTTVGSHTIHVVDPSTGLAQQTTIAVKAEWSQFGFTAAGARYNPYETTIGAGNVGQLTLDWSNNTGYTGAVMPTAAEDDLLISNQAAHYLTNLNAVTGQQIWQTYPVDAASQEAVANGVVFVGNLYLEARTIATGAILWKSSYLIFEGSPVLANGLVYDTANHGALYAFSQDGCGQATCDPLWSYTPTGGFYGTPAVAGGYAYLGGNHLSVLDANTGTVQWTGAITPGESIPTTIVDNGTVFFVANSTYNGGTLYAFNAAGCGQAACSPLWTVYNASGWGNSPAAANGVLYIGGIDNALYTFAAAGCGAPTCTPIWKGTTSSRVLTSPAVANGVVYVSNWYPGAVMAFDASGCGSATCAPLWSASLGTFYVDAPPTVANGVLYVSNDSGMLYAFHLPNTTSVCNAATKRQAPATVCPRSSRRSVR